MMKNSIITISCFAAVLLVILVLSQGLFVELNEGNDRVASLEGRVEEMDNQIEQLNNELASATDVIEQKDEQIASLTDAVDSVKEKIEKVEKTEQTTESETSEESITEEQTTQYAEAINNNNNEMVFGAKQKDCKDYKEEIDDDYVADEDVNYTYAGVYELTAYVATGNPCADGVYPSVGYTVACNDPALWHKWIYIEGYGNYYVHDTGGMASNVIDVFVGSYDEAINFGRRSATVYIIG